MLIWLDRCSFLRYSLLIMEKFLDDRKMDELLALAKDAYEKAKVMYETATEIAEKWENRYQEKQAAKQQTGAIGGN